MENRKTGFIETVMRYRQIMLLAVALLMIAGVYALMVMPRQEYPTFIIRQGVVIGVCPGVSSETVEEQLTRPLERYLLTFPEVNRKKTYSHSRNGIAIIFVELADEVKDKDVVWSKIKHSLTLFKPKLPTGVLAVIANDNFGDVASLLIAMESDDKTYREMDGFLDVLEDRLRQIPSVANINRHGSLKEQISIYIDHDQLSAYGIGSSVLMMNLLTQGFVTGNSKIENRQMNVPIYIADTHATEREIEEQIVYSDPLGNMIRVKDIARVVREYPEAESYITNNGKRCVLLSLEVKPSENVVFFGKDVDQVLKLFQEELPKSVSMSRIADQPHIVSKSINNFLLSLLTAIIVVMVTMMLFPFRVAAVAVTSIPISLFISIAIMYFTGIPLNLVTLSTLIVVLGMICDNSVVIVDGYINKLDMGISRWEASVASAKEYLKSIITATLAISITFFPFLIVMKGIVYDFLEYFPWTMIISLTVSLLVSALVIPYLQYFLIRKGLVASKRKGLKERKSPIDILQSGYNRLLEVVFDYPKTTLTVALVSVVAAVVLFVKLPQRMMPVVERNQFAVEIYLPHGSPLEQTAAVSDSMEHILRRDARVTSVTAFVGVSSPRFHLVYAPNMPSPGYAQFIVNTASAKATDEMLAEYTDKYAFHFPEAYVKFKQLDFLAVDAPIEVRFSGDNIQKIKEQANKLIAHISTMDECLYVRSNFEEMQPVARVEINPTKAGRLGMNSAMASMYLTANYGEVPVSTMWEGDYPLSVVIKSEQRDRGFNSIGDVHVSGVIPGVSVPLRQIADVKAEWTEGKIVRRNGIRTISVFADLKWSANTNETFNKVRKYMNTEIIPSLPDGIEVEYGGEVELNAEIIPDMIRSIIIAVLIIFLILMCHFGKFNKAFIVFLSSALTFFGAAFGVWVMGIDFSVTAMLGIVTLVGLMVRNGIIMFDYTDELYYRQKMPFRQAAIEAGKRRMRPIFITSSSTAMGVVPMIISGDLMWSPLGTVIFFGTINSMICAVTVLPVVYWMVFKKKNSQ